MFRVLQGGAPPPTAQSVARIIANYDDGVVFDASDLSTLWQDTGASTAVTADSDPVRRWDDLSVNARNATTDADAKRPLYKTAGGLHWLEFDGTDDWLSSSLAPGSTDRSLLIAWRPLTNIATQPVIGWTERPGSTGNWYVIQIRETPLGDNYFACWAIDTTDGAAMTTNDRVTIASDAGVATELWVNGVVVDTNSGTLVPSGVLEIGASKNNTSPHTLGGLEVDCGHIRIYAAVSIIGTLSAADRETIARWLGIKSGVSW